MVAILRKIVKVEPGGVARVQSDQLREGAVAEVLVTINTVETDRAFGSTWKTFIGAGVGCGRSVEEIDASIREPRDEWPQ